MSLVTVNFRVPRGPEECATLEEHADRGKAPNGDLLWLGLSDFNLKAGEEHHLRVVNLRDLRRRTD
jgi:hypothetical protein